MGELEMEPMNLEPTDSEPTYFEPTDFMQPRYECWRAPSRTMKRIYLCLATLILVGAIIYLSWPSNGSKKNANNPDTELHNLAVYYIKSIDKNSQPCEDFYAFACGNLRNKYRIENKDHFDTIAMLGKGVRIFLAEFFNKPLTAFDSATLRQMKVFYEMCIDKTKIDTEGIEQMLNLLNEIGGWPLLTNDSENSESWEQTVGTVNRAGFATVFPYQLQYIPDPNNVFDTIMVLVPLLNANDTRLLPDEKQKLDYVKLIASLLNATNDRLHYDVKNCIDFESELQKLTNSVDQDPKMYTLESLRMAHPEIAWETFFQNTFFSTGIEVSSNVTVLLSHPQYSIKVSELLNKTSAKIIRNWIVWRLIAEAIPLMPEKFREAKNAFEQRTVSQSRMDLDCVDILIDKAKVLVGYLYIKNRFDELAKDKFQGMINNIEIQAFRFLKNFSWMGNETYIKIIESLASLETELPHLADHIDLTEGLEIRSYDMIFANYRRLAKAHRNFEYGRLTMSEKDTRQFFLFEHATKVDGYYFPLLHTIYMTAAIFQRPFFSASQPMYLNYGGIGFTIAHEITHGLKILSVCNNEECQRFDRFQEKRKCIEKLYGGYVLKQLNKTVNGKRTLKENIGDLIGLKLSYRAYEKFAKVSEEQLLPGLNYTARQWFWINAATTFCSHESDAALRKTIKTNEHSPAEARVNVAFANTEEFSRDFECPIGSRMNPVHKCGFQ